MSPNPVTGAGVDQNLFIQLLVAQLRNQDPLNPVQSQEFVSQLASLSTVQSLTTLNASFAEMLKLQQLTQGAELIGKTVTYTPAEGGAAATGRVDQVSVEAGRFVLRLDTNTTIGLDQVVSARA